MVVLVSKGGKYSQRYLHSNNGLVLHEMPKIGQAFRKNRYGTRTIVPLKINKFQAYYSTIVPLVPSFPTMRA